MGIHQSYEKSGWVWILKEGKSAVNHAQPESYQVPDVHPVLWSKTHTQISHALRHPLPPVEEDSFGPKCFFKKHFRKRYLIICMSRGRKCNLQYLDPWVQTMEDPPWLAWNRYRSWRLHGTFSLPCIGTNSTCSGDCFCCYFDHPQNFHVSKESYALGLSSDR